MKSILVFLCILLGSANLIGQDSVLLKIKPLRSIQKGKVLAYALVKTRDDGQSPLLYRGPEAYIRTYRERFRSNINTRIEADFSIGNPKTRKQQTVYRMNIVTISANLNYHALFRLSDAGARSQWQLGPMLGNVIDTRLYYFLPNNSFSYEFANFIGLSAAYTRQVQLRKYTTTFSWRGHTSLFAHVIRPNYIGMEPAAVYESPTVQIMPLFLEENKLALPNKFFLLRSEISADLHRKDKKNFRLFYAWTLTVDMVSNPLVTARHYLGFGYTFNKTKKPVQLRKLFKRKKKPASISMSRNDAFTNEGGM